MRQCRFQRRQPLGIARLRYHSFHKVRRFVDQYTARVTVRIAADPTRADAYYWKGVNLIGKATLQGDKMVAPPGTAEAFQKYLELQPSGTYADAAKQMLTSIGSSIETTYGKKKAAKK